MNTKSMQTETYRILDAIAGGAPAGIPLDRLAHALAHVTGQVTGDLLKRLGRLGGHGLVVRAGCRWRLTPAGRAVHMAAGQVRGARAGQPFVPADSFQQRLWQAMRKLKKASTRDLAVLADNRNCEPLHLAWLYLRRLQRAGYIADLPRRKGNAPLTWVLLRDTGPRAPVAHCDGFMSDPNTGEVHQGALAPVNGG